MKFINLTIISGMESKTAGLPKNQSLLQALHGAGIYSPAICGGRGTCGKCKVKLVEGSIKPSKADISYFSQEDIETGYRLSCTAYPSEDLTIELSNPDENKISVVSSFKPINNNINSIFMEKVDISKDSRSLAAKLQNNNNVSVPLHILDKCSIITDSHLESVYVYKDRQKIVHISAMPVNLYAIAIDIGTTTISLGLVDLQTGRLLGQHSMVNKQRELGADVITRIQKASNGNLPTLSSIVRAQISHGVYDLCKNNSIDIKHVIKIAIAANTTMLHLLLGLSCSTLGVYPFTPVTLDFVSFNYKEIFTGDLNATVDILPGLSTYVGADITAGILFTEMHKADKPEFFLDIGTNGEMAVAAGGNIYCTSTAAGPAFEGGNIAWGTGSIPGAISTASYINGDFEVSTIDNAAPIGICGSGVIDITYEALLNGLILKNGRFNKEISNSELVIAKTFDGQSINFTQKDVRELQLGKSAIRSGIDALLKFTGLEYKDLQTLYIAGGFGYRLNFRSGVGIGLIPEELEDKIEVIGNASLGGAVKYLLDSSTRDTISEIASAASEFSLSKDKYFNKIFFENMYF